MRGGSGRLCWPHRRGGSSCDGCCSRRIEPKARSQSDVHLRPYECTGDSELHFEEGIGVKSKGLEGDEAEYVWLGFRVCDSLGVDFGGICGLADLGSAPGVGRGFLYLETLVGLLVELESHREHWRRSRRRFYPNFHVGVELHVRHGDLNGRFAVGLGHLGLDC